MSRAAEPSAATTTGYRIDDRYRLDTGRVFLSGAQALARLPLEQLRIDRELLEVKDRVQMVRDVLRSLGTPAKETAATKAR